MLKSRLGLYEVEGFNRYMVECECHCMMKLTLETATVLIDTWWNVNINNYDSHTKSTTVLIDTWWNVNSFKRIFLT